MARAAAALVEREEKVPMSDVWEKLVTLLSLLALAGPTATCPFAQQAQEAEPAGSAELRAAAHRAPERALDLAVRAALLPEAYAIRAEAGVARWSAVNAGLGLRAAFTEE